jgi:butyryl-CoA dehydrogenase
MSVLAYLEDFHEDVRETARGAAEEIKKTAAEADENEDHSIIVKNLKRLGELNLLGIHTPEKYGGQGLDVRGYAVATEELGKVCGSTGVSYDGHHLAVDAINFGGTEEQKMKYLPPFCKDKIGSFAITEPMAGSDIANIQTRAELKGNEYVINGGKHFITNGSIADTIVVYVTTDPEKKARGISTFLVEKENPGFKVSKDEKKLGTRGSPTTEFFLDNCIVPKEKLLGGEEGKGFNNSLETIDIGRISIAAQSTGLSKAALEDAIAWTKERVQFGRSIASFQAIQFIFADMAVKIAAMEQLTYYAAWLVDHKEKAGKEIAIAKLFASEAAIEITSKTIELLGGSGYSRDYPVERYHRDARLMDIGEGTSEVHRIVISRALLG